MEGQTISDRKQFREVLEGELTRRLNLFISVNQFMAYVKAKAKEEASHVCVYPQGYTTNDRCIVCGIPKN